MTDNGGSSEAGELEYKRQELAFRKLEADRRFALDNSFAKKWASVLWPSFATAAVAIAGFSVNYYQSQRLASEE